MAKISTMNIVLLLIFVVTIISKLNCVRLIKGTATLMITALYMIDLNKPCILIPVSSKSVEKLRSCRRLNICKRTAMEAAIL